MTATASSPSTTAQIFDKTKCLLGEGALWHPLRKQLFWFDILNNTLYAKNEAGLQNWIFDHHVSASGWLSKDSLLIASETGLLMLDLNTNTRTPIIDIEADNPFTRSNDGRADPFGGFWISTMGKKAEHEAGTIYRYYRGEVRQIISQFTIPNSICFSPDGQYAYFADTAQQIIWRQALDKVTGWPEGNPEVFLDLSQEGLNPDGSIIDAAGCLWNAQWGASRVACYSPEGVLLSEVSFPATQITCPAFAGKTLYVTSASEGLDETQHNAGMTFSYKTTSKGQTEHQVLI